MQNRCPLFRTLRFLLVALFFSGAVVRGGQPGFSTSLTDENRAAAGLTRLTPAQLASLDTQVQQDVSAARAGRTTAFASTFTHRRSPVQRKEAGLDLLSTPELNRLDTLVAAAIAATPSPSGSGATPVFSPTSPTANWIETTPKHFDVHGEIGFTYAWSSDHSRGYSSWAETSVTDPSKNLTVTVGIGQGEFKDRRPGCGLAPWTDPY